MFDNLKKFIVTILIKIISIFKCQSSCKSSCMSNNITTTTTYNNSNEKEAVESGDIYVEK